MSSRYDKKTLSKTLHRDVPFGCQTIIAVSDKVGLVTDEGSNAAKSGFGYFEDDDDMEDKISQIAINHKTFGAPSIIEGAPFVIPFR